MAAISLPDIVQQKLAAFERIEAEFEQCFHFLEEVHGQKRFSNFPVAYTVHYLHALWIAECKTSLLSVSKTVKEYEGRQSLELLRRWQEEGDTASVVDFLSHKLDMLPLADITLQVQEARRSHADTNLTGRLEHGRIIMLNRGMNLLLALDTIFSLPQDELQKQVSMACEYYGHQPAHIAQQLQEMDSPLFTFAPHQVLAQRNMLVMNKLGMVVSSQSSDQPEQRSWRVDTSTMPFPPYAEHVVDPYQEMTSVNFNNVKQHRFVDVQERSNDGI